MNMKIELCGVTACNC